MKMCVAPGCDKPGRLVKGTSRGRYCSPHEHRYYRYGDPLAGPRAPYFLSPEERFWHYVDKTSSPKGCWLWRDGGRASDGYVIFEVINKPDRRWSMLAHRYAWLLKHGREPSETLDHTCYVRHCVNPDHMKEMTLEENQRQGLERRRLERIAYDWMLSQHNWSRDELMAFLLSVDCDTMPVRLAENVDTSV